MLVPFELKIVREPIKYYVDDRIRQKPIAKAQIIIVPNREKYDPPEVLKPQLEYMFNPPQTEYGNFLIAHVGTEDIFNHYYPDKKWDGSDFLMFTSYLSHSLRHELIDFVKLSCGYKFSDGWL